MAEVAMSAVVRIKELEAKVNGGNNVVI